MKTNHYNTFIILFSIMDRIALPGTNLMILRVRMARNARIDVRSDLLSKDIERMLFFIIYIIKIILRKKSKRNIH